MRDDCYCGVGPSLRYAAFLGLESVVEKLLLDENNDVNSQGGKYNTALQAASASSNEQIVRLLLRAGADVNLEGGYMESPLKAASSPNIVNLLISHGANLDSTSEKWGTALYQASATNFKLKVKLLLGHGADSNVLGGGWGSPLNVAAARTYDDVVRLLLKDGADPNLGASAAEYSGDKITAVQAASGGDSGRYLGKMRVWPEERFEQSIEKRFPLLRLTTGKERRRAEIVRCLIENGADVNTPPNGNFGTALQIASYVGNLPLVELLLAKGATVDSGAPLEFGTTLQFASVGGNPKIVRLLLARGAKFNSEERVSFGSVLQAASFKGELKIVKAVIASGPDLHAEGGELGKRLNRLGHVH